MRAKLEERNCEIKSEYNNATFSITDDEIIAAIMMQNKGNDSTGENNIEAMMEQWHTESNSTRDINDDDDDDDDDDRVMKRSVSC